MNERTVEPDLFREVEELRARVRELERWNKAVEQAGEALRKSDESFRRIFDHSNDGIFVVDFVQDRIVDANRRASEMLGYTQQELLEIPMSAIHPDEMHKVQASGNTVSQQGLGWTSELSCVTKSGARIPTEMSASVIDLGSKTYMIALVRDISDRKRAEDELRRANERMHADLEAAARIQQALLPRHSLVVDGLRFAWHVRQCERLGGDTLNLFKLDSEHVGFFLVDVSGHGVAAAMHSLAIHRVLSPFPTNTSLLVRQDDAVGVLVATPADVATQLNATFPMDPTTGQYLTMLYGVLNVRTRELRMVSAGQGAPLYVKPGSPPQEIEAYEFPIGIFPDTVYQEFRMTMEPGSRLYVYSDGITDTFDTRGEQFGKDRVVATVAELSNACLQETVQGLVQRSIDFGCEVCLEDDMSVLAIELAGGA